VIICFRLLLSNPACAATLWYADANLAAMRDKAHQAYYKKVPDLSELCTGGARAEWCDFPVASEPPLGRSECTNIASIQAGTTQRRSLCHPPYNVPTLATSSTTCSPRHPLYDVPVLAELSTTWCTGARHVIHHMLATSSTIWFYRCSPSHPPHGVPVLATSSTTCSPRHPPYGLPVLAQSSTTWRTGARRVIHGARRVIQHTVWASHDVAPHPHGASNPKP
jgi:hypothetical protein